jgi:hypothetical protein
MRAPNVCLPVGTQAPNLSTARALAFAASSSRFFGGALVSMDRRRRIDTAATSSTAAWKISSFDFDGLLKPVIFLTNCNEAARTSSSVTGGSKLKSVLIFLHIRGLHSLKPSPTGVTLLGGSATPPGGEFRPFPSWRRVSGRRSQLPRPNLSHRP